MKSIEVNNERTLEIAPTTKGVKVYTVDHLGEEEENFDVTNGEIVMLLNLIRYLKDKGETTVYIPSKKLKEPFVKAEFSKFTEHNLLEEYLLL